MKKRNTALTSAEQQARSPQAVFEQLQAGNMRHYRHGTLKVHKGTRGAGKGYVKCTRDERKRGGAQRRRGRRPRHFARIIAFVVRILRRNGVAERPARLPRLARGGAARAPFVMLPMYPSRGGAWCWNLPRLLETTTAGSN